MNIDKEKADENLFKKLSQIFNKMTHNENDSQKAAAEVAFARTMLKVGDVPVAIKTGCILSKIISFDFNHADKNRISVLLENEDEEMDLRYLRKQLPR